MGSPCRCSGIETDLSDAGSEALGNEDDEHAEKLLGDAHGVAKRVLHGVTLLGRRLLLQQPLLLLVEIVLGPADQVEAVQGGQQERVGLYESGAHLQQDDVAVVHFRAAAHVLVEVELVDQRVAVTTPHSRLNLHYHHQSIVNQIIHSIISLVT